MEKYFSENMLVTKRDTRLVLPTAKAPSVQIFFWIIPRPQRESPSGDTLTVNAALTFKPAFNGAKNVFMYATNGTENSGWQTRGTWTVAAAGDAVTADSATPDSGSGASQTFALAYSSTLGATNLTTTWVWFTDTSAGSAANSCLAYYDRPAHMLFLLNGKGVPSKARMVLVGP